jgi:phosphohistidine phosphatase
MKPMELYLFRHGIAVDRENPTVKSDPDRHLTEDGIRKTRAAAAGLKRLQIPFDKILTSPWLRASQTAEILGDVLDMSVEALPELAGDHSVDELLQALAHQRVERLLLVGHEPLLGNTAGRLLCGSADFRIDLKKSGACALEVDGLPSSSPATLLWVLTSKQLRLMGK